MKRPALQELLTDLKKEKIDIVLVYKIDRLTRSPKDFYQLIEFFEQAKIDFISITERFDTSTPELKLNQTFEIILPNLIHKSKKRNLS